MRHPLKNSDASLAVWIVEDDTQYRETLSYLLDHTSGLHCAAAFADYEAVEAKVTGTEPWEVPDVVLMDYELPGRNGIDGILLLKKWLSPTVPILMLTVHDRDDVIFEAFSAGASAYMLKDAPFDDLIAAMWQARKGGMLMPPRVADKVLRLFRVYQPTGRYDLTRREKEILQLMGDGLVQKQIAGALFLSPHTINSHVRNIYEKLHVHSGIEAVAKAIREHLI